MRCLTKIYKTVCGLFSAAVLAAMGQALYAQWVLPDQLYITEGQTPSILQELHMVSRPAAGEAVSAGAGSGSSYRLSLCTQAGITVKDVQVQIVDKKMVIPCGTPFGIKMFTDGVMVVGMSDIDTGSGLVNPAKNAGLKIGDIVTEIDGVKVAGNSQIGDLISQSGGRSLTVCYRRGNQEYTGQLTAVKSCTDGVYKAGIWVRDSSAGIGTMTYYDLSRGAFAGLGHAVCDVDTSEVMPLSSGEIVSAVISGVKAGQAGLPGELRGSFVGQTVGEIELNTPQGVFGSMEHPPIANEPVEMATKYEIEEGPAQILTTISGQTPQKYDIYIDKIQLNDDSPNKNMVVRVTDSRLLSQTGGIVQGMSGSPILQNGKLIGAVTHVFVNDPTKGYAIFIENMDKTMNSVTSTNLLAS